MHHRQCQTNTANRSVLEEENQKRKKEQEQEQELEQGELQSVHGQSQTE
jgi:hypothetical protein